MSERRQATPSLLHSLNSEIVFDARRQRSRNQCLSPSPLTSAIPFCSHPPAVDRLCSTPSTSPQLSNIDAIPSAQFHSSNSNATLNTNLLSLATRTSYSYVPYTGELNTRVASSVEWPSLFTLSSSPLLSLLSPFSSLSSFSQPGRVVAATRCRLSKGCRFSVAEFKSHCTNWALRRSGLDIPSLSSLTHCLSPSSTHPIPILVFSQLIKSCDWTHATV